MARTVGSQCSKQSSPFTVVRPLHLAMLPRVCTKAKPRGPRLAQCRILGWVRCQSLLQAAHSKPFLCLKRGEHILHFKSERYGAGVRDKAGSGRHAPSRIGCKQSNKETPSYHAQSLS